MGALIRRALLACVLFLGLAVAGTPAYAQTGQVKGKIVDAKDQPVEKAQIIIEATDVAPRPAGAASLHAVR